MTFTATLTALALALTPGSTVADPGDWSSERFYVDALSESCALSSTYSFDGRSDVRISLHFNAEFAVLFLTSADWSAEEDAVYEGFGFHFLSPDASFHGEIRGYAGDGYERGFMAKLNPAFVDSFAASRRLLVTRTSNPGEEAAIVTDLNLVGSGAAIAALKRCARLVADRNAEQARREARYTYIARDPFAAPTANRVEWARAPSPHFPERALSRGIANGSVQLSCDVVAGGAATGCRIDAETPEDVGFGQAALRSMAQARFGPRMNGRQTFGLRFTLAREPSPSTEE